MDSVFWIALISPRDSLHETALALAKEHENTSLVTTHEVLLEVLNFFSWRGSELRQAATTLIEKLSTQHNVIVIAQSGESFEAGKQHYANRLDKSYSGTDCVSMCRARERGIKNILTTDEHFGQEGFEVLMMREEF